LFLFKKKKKKKKNRKKKKKGVEKQKKKIISKKITKIKTGFFKEKDNKKVTLSHIESRLESYRNIYSSFEIGTFQQGQAGLVANSIRRALLSEVSSLSIVAVEIRGINHEYVNIHGVRESALDILLNLKDIIIVSDTLSDIPEIGFVSVVGPAVVTAAHLRLPSHVQCVDPEQYIATVADNGRLQIKVMICRGKNFAIQPSFHIITKAFRSYFSIYDKSFNIVGLKKDPMVSIASKKPGKKPAKKLRLSKKIIENYCKRVPTAYAQHSWHLSAKSGHPSGDSSAKYAHHSGDSSDKSTRHSWHSITASDLQELPAFSKPWPVGIPYWKQPDNQILLVDSIFMPVSKVNFSIQNTFTYYEIKHRSLRTKFQKKLKQEKIFFEIWTNGSIQPKNTISIAAYKLIHLLIPFQRKYRLIQPLNAKDTLYLPKKAALRKSLLRLINKSTRLNFFSKNPGLKKKKKKPELHTELPTFAKKISYLIKPFSSITSAKAPLKFTNYSLGKNKKLPAIMEFSKKPIDIVYLDLSNKHFICLKRANINTISELTQYSRADLLTLKGFNKNAVSCVATALRQLNLKLQS